MSAREPVSLDEIREAMSASGGRVAEAARMLGIGERTLYRKLKRYQLS